jgi:hypothetical protein
MSEKYSTVLIDNSKLDYEGATISGVRMDPSIAYDRIPNLLQKFINNNDSYAWTEITTKKY